MTLFATEQERVEFMRGARGLPEPALNATWDVTAQHGLITLSLRLDTGERSELTLLPEDALTLGDKLIELADHEQRSGR